MRAKHIHIANLCSIVLAGAALLDIDQLEADDADCVIEAHGSSKIDIAAGSLRSCKINAHGVSHISLGHALTTNMKIAVEGSSCMEAKTLRIANVCSIAADGATKLDIEQLNADDVDCVVKAQGTARIAIAAGAVRSCKIDADGASAVRANNVHCAKSPSVNANGVASVHINGTRYTRKW